MVVYNSGAIVLLKLVLTLRVKNFKTKVADDGQFGELRVAVCACVFFFLKNCGSVLLYFCMAHKNLLLDGDLK